MKGYKAFNKDMSCRGKQYQENTVYEEEGAVTCCRPGVMHFCETPMEVLDYYPLIDDDGEFTEFAEVEALDSVLTDGTKRATKKLKIGAKLSFRDFIRAAVSVVIESTKHEIAKDTDLSDNGGDWAQIGSSGDGAQIGSSGYGAKIGSSGYGAKIGSSGDGAQIGSSGYGAKIGSSGDGAQIGSSGDWAKIGSSGYGAKIGSSGDGAKINLRGTESIGAAIGYKSTAKGAIGNWIVLAEWVNSDGNKWIPACVRAGQIDGIGLKPDTRYILKNGEFVEADAEEGTDDA